jgi:hypothetical protein
MDGWDIISAEEKEDLQRMVNEPICFNLGNIVIPSDSEECNGNNTTHINMLCKNLWLP